MFTEQAFLQRCSGEWPQVQYADGSASRLHMSTLINLDESYRFLRMLVLISGSSSGKGTEPVEMASELNRILQTGATSYACKNAGSFGTNVERKAVSVLGFGNAHPSKYVPILSGAAGNHDVACCERLLQTSGRPVEPHSGLPLGLEVPDGFKPWFLG